MENEDTTWYKPVDESNEQINERPLSRREIKRLKKKMSRKERRHTDFPGDPVKGRALHKWAVFFFVLTCIGTGLTGAMIVLPFFIVLFGLVSVIVWLVCLAFFTIFTLGLIWLSDETKIINQNWMNFNNSLFNSTNTIYEFALRVIPSILVSGGILIAISWMFLILGFNLDNERKKKYKAKMIALGIITAIYITFLVINVIRMGDYVNVGSSSSSL